MQHEKIENPEIDTTRFVNIDTEPFDIYINGKLARHLEPGEEQTLVKYVAQVGAKHLVDRLLQKQGISDTNTDKPVRRDAFARILPEMAEERAIAPLSKEDRDKAVKEQLERQDKVISSLQKEREESAKTEADKEKARAKTEEEKDKQIAELMKRLEALEKGKKEKKEVIKEN